MGKKGGRKWGPKAHSKNSDCGTPIINSVHTRCIVKKGGFTRGVCKNQGFY